MSPGRSGRHGDPGWSRPADPYPDYGAAPHGVAEHGAAPHGVAEHGVAGPPPRPRSPEPHPTTADQPPFEPPAVIDLTDGAPPSEPFLAPVSRDQAVYAPEPVGHEPEQAGYDEPAPTDGGAGQPAVALPLAGGVDPGSLTRRQRRQLRIQRQAQLREARWRNSRYAVPYPIDGPRITVGVLWFGLIMAAALVSPLAVAALVSLVAALAGLQTAYAWIPPEPTVRWTAMAAAGAGAFAGLLGSAGVVVGAVLALVLGLLLVVVAPIRGWSAGGVVGVVARAAIFPALAGASMIVLDQINPVALISLVGLVSAYETGDYLIGTGSSNGVEGPLAGFFSLAAVGFTLWVISPALFGRQGVILFAALTAVCCVLGQILASALLPRGASWAPALRRLDSYLLAAPIWMLLLSGTAVQTHL
ncbi:MAG: hypothetical protein ACK5RL_00040 [Acidimicrobiales bacterium]